MPDCIICELNKDTPYLDWIDGEWFACCEDCHNRFYIDVSIKL